MYILCKMCCICLKYKSGMKPLHTLHEKQLNCYLKISSESAGQSDGDVSRDCQICEECVGRLYSVCEFIEVCQRGRAALKKYISEMQSADSVNDRPTVESYKTNMELYSASVKTEVPSEDLHGCTIHSEVNLKPDLEDCLYEPDQVIFEDRQDINIKTEVETDIQENDPLSTPDSVTTGFIDSVCPQTSSVHGVFQYNRDILKQTDSSTDSNLKKEHAPTNLKKEYESTDSEGDYESTKQKHLLTHTGEKPYECGICNKRFTTSGNLNVHVRIHTGEEPHECKICKKKFNRSTNLKRHSKTHERVIYEDTQQEINIKTEVESDMPENDPLSIPDPVTAEEVFSVRQQTSSVEGIFQDNRDILKQVDSFTDSNSDKECEPIDSEDPDEPSTQKHKTTHTGEKPYECETCKKRFGRPSGLKEHLRVHTGEKRYECEICKKRLASSCGLKEHLRVHTGEKPYECRICKKKFTYSSVLRKHLITHTGDKPHECEICKKTFNQSSSLTRHLRLHTGEKPYECKICKKRFNQSTGLRTHSKIHTGDKPFGCAICKKRFVTSGNLTDHLRTHSGEKPYECKICQKRFLHPRYLKIHLRKNHNHE